MFKQLLKFISLITISLVSFVVAQAVQAQPISDIVVSFNPNPLFGESNFLPGHTASGLVNIQNNGQSNRNVTVKAINFSDPNHFGETLRLKIQNNSQVYFNDTLANFFGQASVNLATINAGGSVSYDFAVDFIDTAGNDYQNKSLGFDIELVFTGEEGGGDGTPIVIASGGGGGGGGGPVGLTIFNELASNQGANSAMISWFTNHPATSRVIYSPELGVHTFNLGSDANYGYAYSTSEDSSLVTYREIYLASLEPDTLYYYRVISHRGSEGDTVSTEHSFRTAGVLGLKEGEITSTDETSSFLPPILVKKIQPLVKGIKEFFDPVQAQESGSGEQVARVDDLSGDAGMQFKPMYDSQCEGVDIWSLWPLIILYFLGLLLNYFSKKRRRTVIWFVLLLAGALLFTWFFCPGFSNPVWFFIALLGVLNLWSYLSSINLHYRKWPTFFILTLYFIVLVWVCLECIC